jgi:multidrug transporter EmrE-like cation transporter
MSLILLKRGLMDQNNFSESLIKLSAWLNLLLNPNIMLGVVFFAVSFITWMIALSKIDLSLAYPTVSITYVIIALASWYFFNENISFYRWLGIGIIMLGIIVMYQK